MNSDPLKAKRGCVAVVEWEVPREHQLQFIEAVAGLVEANIGLYKGMRSATFHRSIDGTRVINYAIWESRKAWEEALDLPGRGEVTEEIKALIGRIGARSLGVEGFYVERVIGEA